MKKLLILILILTLVMTAFTACGGKDNGETVIEEQTGQAEQSGEDSDADADAEPEDPHPAMERHIMEANTDAVNFFIVFIPLTVISYNI